MSVTLTLPYPVSANIYWRSFLPKGGKRALVVLSDVAKAYKRTAHQLAMVAGVRTPITGRVALNITLHPPRPKDAAKRALKQPGTWDEDVRSIDLDNALKVTIDCLKGVVIDDDKWVWKIEASRGQPVENGAVVVVVTPIQPAPDLFEYPKDRKKAGQDVIFADRSPCVGSL
jgi:crossover junction endodeoxyribonuclease RusA